MPDLTEAAKRFRDSAYSECDADMEQYAQDRQILAAAKAEELSDEPVTVERCGSCGVPWVEHLGLIGTCRELVRLRAALHAILMVEHTLPVGKTSHVAENKRRREIAIEALKKRKEPG